MWGLLMFGAWYMRRWKGGDQDDVEAVDSGVEETEGQLTGTKAGDKETVVNVG
jgi:hypothetical protein